MEELYQAPEMFIDQICIARDTIVEKDDQVKRMAKSSKNAHHVLYWQSHD
jgi:hypothetical protein